MRVSKILELNKRQISFEVFPPKDSTKFENVKNATESIAKLDPSFVSVTFGAGGKGSKYTLEIAKDINEMVPTLVHLTCVGSTRESVNEFIKKLKTNNIENVMALRGDIPENFCENPEFLHASDLVEVLKKEGFCIGGACYPEVHPESSNQEQDIINIKKKVDAGCDFLTTQMFFDNNLFFNFMYKLRQAGVTIPVIPGIMPITNANQVKRAIELSGSFMPQRFKALVDKFGDDAEAMCQAGIAYATDQIIDLYANGINNVHVYSMNKPEVAARIKENISALLK